MWKGKTLLNPVPAELQAKIRAELNEEESSRERDIGHIRAWLAQQPHLPRIDDDNFILAFLRGCKFSLEKTKRKLDMYFTLRGAAPEYFTGRDITRPEVKELFNRNCIGIIPDVTPEGNRVLPHSAFLRDGFSANLDVAFMCISMLIDVMLCEERDPVSGVVFIWDAGIVTPGYAAQWTPLRMRKIVAYVQGALPFRFKQLHVINSHPLVDMVYKASRPLLPEKIRQRVHFHTSDLDSLHEYVPRKMLPQELGGSAGPARQLSDAWVQKLRQYGDWFRQQEQVKADESLRPGKPRNYGEMFGVEGSFRKLDVD